MNGIIVACLSALLALTPMNASYEDVPFEEYSLIAQEYNDGDIISVRELKSETGIRSYSTGRFTSIEVVFKGNVTPEREYVYECTYNGIRYKGTLTLSTSTYSGGITKAVYAGTMYPVE